MDGSDSRLFSRPLPFFTIFPFFFRLIRTLIIVARRGLHARPPGGGCGKLLFGKRLHPFLSLSGCFARASRARCRKNFPAARSVPCSAQPVAAPPSFFRLRNFLPRFSQGERGKEPAVEREIGCRRSFPQLSGMGNRISGRFPRSVTGVKQEIRPGPRFSTAVFHKLVEK